MVITWVCGVNWQDGLNEVNAVNLGEWDEWSSQVPFFVPQKRPKWLHFGRFGGTKNGTWGALIKILRPLFNTNTPPKTPI